MNQKTYTKSKLISDLKHDFRRYCDSHGYDGSLSTIDKLSVFFKSPAYWAIVNFRFGFWVNSRFQKNSNLMKLLYKSLYFTGNFLSVCVVKIEILANAEIGPGLFLSNKGNIILGVQSMGEGCTVHENVTLGIGVDGIPPKVGKHVWIGSDSIIYGGIKIGENLIITKGTVLSRNIPSCLLAGGNPFRVIRKNIDPGPYPIYIQPMEVR